MKKIFKVAGKVFEERGQASLDEVLPLALAEPFWDLKPKVAPGEVTAVTTDVSQQA